MDRFYSGEAGKEVHESAAFSEISLFHFLVQVDRGWG